MLVDQFVLGFTSGVPAILTNICVLPLYPGMIAFLTGQLRAGDAGEGGRFTRFAYWQSGLLGLMVLLGVMTLMLLVGFLFWALNTAIASVLPVILPIIYVVVIILGLMMLSGRNPFTQLSRLEAPVFRNPFVTAYAYGLALAPMTLPCTGPYLVSIFSLSTISGSLGFGQLIFFIGFGLGFGWPLLVLPLLATSAQRQLTRELAKRHTLLTKIAGALLVLIGVLGLYLDWLEPYLMLRELT